MHSFTVLTLAAVAMGKILSIGPSPMRIKGLNDSSINGYVQNCHADASAAGLCYVERKDDENLKLFYYNYSTDANGGRVGAITFNSEFRTDNGTKIIPYVAKLKADPGTNMQLMYFGPGISRLSVFSAGDDGVFFISGLRDDTDWNKTQPAWGGTVDLKRFYLCWQWVGFYWHRSIAWASSLPPQNPSCEPVQLRIGL